MFQISTKYIAITVYSKEVNFLLASFEKLKKYELHDNGNILIVIQSVYLGMGLLGIIMRGTFSVLLKYLPYGGTHIPWFLNSVLCYSAELLTVFHAIFIITSIDCIFIGYCVHLTYHFRLLSEEIVQTSFSEGKDLSVLQKYTSYVSRHRYLLQ